MAALIDSHCHLDFPDFADELPEIVARAEDAGVARMITICTRSTDVDRVRSIADAHPSVYFAAGIHPHEAGGDRLTASDLERLADHPKMVGIGETGLDYFYDHSPREDQQARFREHLDAARELELPVIIHTRDAEEDTMGLLAEAGAGETRDGKRLNGLIHCCSGTQQLSDYAVKIGFFVSFSGIVTFKKAQELRDVASSIPPDRLLVETDAPYLAPVPKRGKRNEPAYVVHTAHHLADHLGYDRHAFAETTTANVLRLFSKLPPISGGAE